MVIPDPVLIFLCVFFLVDMKSGWLSRVGFESLDFMYDRIASVVEITNSNQFHIYIQGFVYLRIVRSSRYLRFILHESAGSR